MDDLLRQSLLDLVHELRDPSVPLIIGGGYGLYLKQLELMQPGALRTLIPMEWWPQPRSTVDIDVLLRPEIVTDAKGMAQIRAALDEIGFLPVPGAEFMQFQKTWPDGRFVKIDFLTGPLGVFHDPRKVRVDDRRVKPRPSVKLHAHRMDEAVDFEKATIELTLSGTTSSGTMTKATILVPQAFSYVLMKLFAFRDRKDDGAEELARHHALDIYRIVAMMSEAEYATVVEMSRARREDPAVLEARSIVSEHFSDRNSLAVLRMREHPLYFEGMDLDTALDVLRELVGPRE